MAFDWQAFDELCEEALAQGAPTMRQVAAANAVPLPCVDNDGNLPIEFDVVGPQANYVRRPADHIHISFGDTDTYDADDEDWHEFWYGVGYPAWTEDLDTPF